MFVFWVGVYVFRTGKKVPIEWAKCHIEHGNFQAHDYANTLLKQYALTLKALRANVIHLTASVRSVCMPTLYRITRERSHTFHGIKRLYINSNCHYTTLCVHVHTCANIFPWFSSISVRIIQFLDSITNWNLITTQIFFSNFFPNNFLTMTFWSFFII